MDMENTFAKKVQKAMGSAIPDWIPRGKWRGVSYGHILTDMRNNFIDGCYPVKCCIKGNLSEGEIKYHQGASHLNSSQVMCINFFKKFFEREEYEGYLLAVLQCCGVSIEGYKIENAVFEYEPDHEEGTNFDFYLILEDGKRISFECKYTETEFGSISSDKRDPDKYNRKWDHIYKNLIANSTFLFTDKKEFYRHYQINRNIVYADSRDYVLFLTPRANDAKGICDGRAYIDNMENQHIRNIYWEDIIQITLLTVAECEPLEDYYFKFKSKYLDSWNEEH